MTVPYFSDEQVLGAATIADVRRELELAIEDLAWGRAEVLPRRRIDCGDAKLSVMGAIWRTRGLAAVKSYPTVRQQFSFLVDVFDIEANRPLAVLAGGELTRLRTAAIAAIAADRGARADASTLALIGGGVQGRTIARGIAQGRRLERILVADPALPVGPAKELSELTGVACTVCSARQAIESAGIVVTATRSKLPVFDGRWLRPGTLVIAIGTSLPTARELDDITLARAGRVVVECKQQAMVEAGEVVLGLASRALDVEKVIDLPWIGRGHGQWRASDEEIVVFKSVGIGLSDLAAASAVLAHLAPRARAASVA